ncbi:MAG: cytochrome c [Hyphomicrobium sp.]|uniref:c-type cytochrome n=1 Tax=Hyphomicrobium sp. TaxID=82 RepID=UPI001320C60E|nr:cytochrome c [Hyphomicrobium sp.]KAB2939759.1 MAG: cytochrome c [Hyphomicrobium sp.]MBZ0211284.1 cytochrome c [Hyphomicrobium sp.]MCZ7594565.1 cytochrome c [Hyphomicrobium sp.]
MRRQTLGDDLRASVCALALLVALSPAARGDDVAKGEELAKALCAECHLNPGQGEKRGPMGVPGFAAVANRPLQTFDGVVGWLKSVPPMMPDHHLTQDEMFALAAYIMSLRKAP